jgi:enoyl-CoA hydratase
MNSQFVRTKVSQVGATAVLTLASDKVNALDVEVLGEIASFVDQCEQDPEVRALIVTGEGPVFSAGLNVNEVVGNEKRQTEVLLEALRLALLGLFQCPKPTVVAINGSAIAGGCVLACTCDRRLIAEGARIGVTELRVGVSVPILAVELLKHTCGSRAEQLMLDAQLLDTEAAGACGLTHLAVPSTDLHAAALAAAEHLASLDPRAYALAKAASRRGVLSAIGEEESRLLDRRVLDHWHDDQTRANLERLIKPRS